MNNGLRKSALILLVVASSCLAPDQTRSDVIYVWCYDGTLARFDTNGVATTLTNNLPGWNGPVGLALDSSGNLYAGVPSRSQIWRFSPEGVATLVGNLVDSVSGLAFDGTGDLYATLPNYSEVLRLEYFPPFGYYMGVTNRSQSHLIYPTSLAFDRTGNLFVANSILPPWGQSSLAHTIEMFSPYCEHLGTFAADLNEPWGLAFDLTGNLHVSNCGTNPALRNRIVKFSPDGARATLAIAGLNQPRGLAFESAGHLHVANAGDGTIRRIPPGGVLASTLVSGLNSPTSIAIHPGVKFWKATTITLESPAALPGGGFQFSFTNTPTVGFSVWATTNPSSPGSNWTSLGGVEEIASGHFLFTDPDATNHPQRFYRVSSP